MTRIKRKGNVSRGQPGVGVGSGSSMQTAIPSSKGMDELLETRASGWVRERSERKRNRANEIGDKNLFFF